MAALAADRFCAKRCIFGTIEIPMKANTTIYGGGMVAVGGADGYAAPAANTANMVAMGVAKAQKTCGATAGSVKVEVEYGIFEMNASSITQAMVGDLMYVVDDNTVDDSDPGNTVKAGILIKYISATKGEVLISPFSKVCA